MKKFEKPMVEFVEIENDVITTSLCMTSGGSDTPVVYDP